MRISDWSSDGCSAGRAAGCGERARRRRHRGRRAAGPAAGRSPGGGDPGVGILAVRYSFDYSRIMETEQAIAALTALGHATRLAAFRLLVEAGPDGRMAGAIAEALAVQIGRASCRERVCQSV